MPDAGRVVTGVAGGLRLEAPGAGTRPFSNKVKQALFSMVEAEREDIWERPMLDLFAGSGSLGLEALSRGANVVQTYGLTEACSQVCTLAAGEASGKPGSSGRPLLGVGGAMDLVAGVKRVVVIMDHTNKAGETKLLKQCTLPLTGQRQLTALRALVRLGVGGDELLGGCQQGRTAVQG